MKPLRTLEIAGMLLLLWCALLACKKNEANTRACEAAGKTSAEDCERCCKARGSSGYKSVNGKCSCLGG